MLDAVLGDHYVHPIVVAHVPKTGLASPLRERQVRPNSEEAVRVLSENSIALSNSDLRRCVGQILTGGLRQRSPAVAEFVIVANSCSWAAGLSRAEFAFGYALGSQCFYK